MLGIMIVVEKCLLRRIFGTKEKEQGVTLRGLSVDSILC